MKTKEEELKEEEHKHNWCSICATDDNRNQCSEKNCTIYPICRIKQTRTQTLEKVKEKIEEELLFLEHRIEWANDVKAIQIKIELINIKNRVKELLSQLDNEIKC